MKKFAVLLILLISIIAIVSCKNDDMPEGMQLVKGGEDIGYYFYVPEEWTVANVGDIAGAYASNIDKTSATYIEIEPPAGTVEEYFNESLKEFPNAPEILVANQSTPFGTSDSAKAIMYIYNHTHDGKGYRTMQIFVSFEGRFGIFTFTAATKDDSKEESIDNTDKYALYSDNGKRQSIIDNFKFVSKNATSDNSSQIYEKDEDGYNLVSDKSTSKFSLYLPDDFNVNFASGMVSASLSDGSNITMSRAREMGDRISVSDYFENRLKDLSGIVSDTKVVEFTDENGEVKTINGKAKFGDANNAASMEYTFVYNGETYHVYQVCAITYFNGYVFTYTAKEENYQKHIDVINKICEKAELK